MSFKDDTPALFISEEGAKSAAIVVATQKNLKWSSVYTHRRSVLGETGWTASIIHDNRFGKHNARYVTNDDVERFL